MDDQQMFGRGYRVRSGRGYIEYGAARAAKKVSTLSQRTRGPNCFFLSVCSFVSSLLPGEEERIDQSTTDRAPEPLNLISKPPHCR